MSIGRTSVVIAMISGVVLSGIAAMAASSFEAERNRLGASQAHRTASASLTASAADPAEAPIDFVQRLPSASDATANEITSALAAEAARRGVRVVRSQVD